jgi:DNA-binding PadR family transcriptional regulator
MKKNAAMIPTSIDATVERFVKEYLDIVILALIAGKPMCGTDILDIVHRNFNVLLSPGTIYPLLHRLKKEGLLEYECSIKKKVYKPARGSEANIRRILEEHSQANEILNDFLKYRSLMNPPEKDEELWVRQSSEANIT